MEDQSWDEYVRLRSRRGALRLGLLLLVILLTVLSVDYVAILVLVATGTEEADIPGVILLALMPLVLAALSFMLRRTWRRYRAVREELSMVHGRRDDIYGGSGGFAEERTKMGIRRLGYGVSSWLSLLAFLFAGTFSIAGIVVVVMEITEGDIVRDSDPFYAVLAAMLLLAVLLFIAMVKVVKAYRKIRETAWRMDAGMWVPGDGIPSNRGVVVLGVAIALISFVSSYTLYYFYNPAKQLKDLTEDLMKPVLMNLEPFARGGSLHDFSEGLAGCEIDGRYGYIDRSGNLVIEPRFDSVSPFNEGLAVVEVEGRHGYIDNTGEIVIEPVFGTAASFSEGLALVSTGDGFGFIDKAGRRVIEPRFELAASFREGLACVLVEGNYGYIDRTGSFAIEPVYWTAFSFSDGLACVQYDNNDYHEIVAGDRKSGDPVYMEVLDNIITGYIDPSGRPVIWPRFQGAWPFSGGFARVTIEDKEWFIDQSGRITFPAHPPGLDPGTYSFTGVFFHDGMVCVSVGEKAGYMDARGNLAIQPVYDDACDFSEGLAAVSMGDKWGYVDKSGDLVIEMRFDHAGDFHEGLAYVETGEERGYIDSTGTMVIELPARQDVGTEGSG